MSEQHTWGVDMSVELKVFVLGGIMVQLDYRKTIEEMVKEGRYFLDNLDINSENFPITLRQSGLIEVHFFYFNQAMSEKNIVGEMDKQGFRPGEIPELLAVGAQHPDKVRRYRLIVGLGSVGTPLYYGEQPMVPVVWRPGHLQAPCIRLDHLDSWRAGARFLAVHK